MTLEEAKANYKEGWKVNQKIAEAIIKRINVCNGECPCHNESYDKHCACSDYREKDVCHCGLYIKE